MKKVLLNRLQLDANKLSNKEKKEITGGWNDWDDDCVIRCKCPGDILVEKFVRRSQCHKDGQPCLQSSECENPPVFIP